MLCVYVLINKNHFPSLMLNRDALSGRILCVFQKQNLHIKTALAITAGRMRMAPSRCLVQREGGDGVTPTPPHPGAPQTQLDDPDVLPAGGTPGGFPKGVSASHSNRHRGSLSHLRPWRSRASTPQLASASCRWWG